MQQGENGGQETREEAGLRVQGARRARSWTGAVGPERGDQRRADSGLGGRRVDALGHSQSQVLGSPEQGRPGTC